MTKYAVVFITVSGKKEAGKITAFLIKNKFAACVNQVPLVYSTYWWKGKIERSKELLLIIKTKKTMIKKIITEVKKIHSYTVPEIISIPIDEGSKDYLNWIEDCVK